MDRINHCGGKNGGPHAWEEEIDCARGLVDSDEFGIGDNGGREVGKNASGGRSVYLRSWWGFRVGDHEDCS